MGEELRELLRTGPGLIDPRATPGVPKGEGKGWARADLAEVGRELAKQQEMLHAASRTGGPDRRVMLVLQGMDCAGKGGTVKAVAGAMNPMGVRVVGFGPPTEEELANHFLWRIERALPGYGQVGVFDRSHYEDVLIVRVRSLVPEPVWQGRYDEINQWEAGLVAGGTTIVKVMLHISYEEQTRRLARRLDRQDKHWKYNPGDIDERKLWGAYQEAYAEALQRCDSDPAPWYVVPADRRWYRNWAVARLLLAAFQDLRLSYPAAGFDVARERRRLARTAAGPE